MSEFAFGFGPKLGGPSSPTSRLTPEELQAKRDCLYRDYLERITEGTATNATPEEIADAELLAGEKYWKRPRQRKSPVLPTMPMDAKPISL